MNIDPNSILIHCAWGEPPETYIQKNHIDSVIPRTLSVY